MIQTATENLEKVVDEIQIKNKFGVSGVGIETKSLADEALKLKKEYILDMGTGTGYTAIFLAKKGYKVDACDISENALICARNNAKANNAQIQFFRSHLFSNAESVYDLIIFNPPANSQLTKLTEYITVMTWFLRKSRLLSKFFAFLIHGTFKNNRIELLVSFIMSAKKHLKEKGIILLHLVGNEPDSIQKELPEVMLSTVLKMNSIEHIIKVEFPSQEVRDVHTTRD